MCWYVCVGGWVCLPAKYACRGVCLFAGMCNVYVYVSTYQVCVQRCVCLFSDMCMCSTMYMCTCASVWLLSAFLCMCLKRCRPLCGRGEGPCVEGEGPCVEGERPLCGWGKGPCVGGGRPLCGRGEGPCVGGGRPLFALPPLLGP